MDCFENFNLKMDKKILNKKGKHLAYILRHNPESVFANIDSDGWIDVENITNNSDITLNELEEIVKLDNKSRYSFNIDKTKIRANQGHSLKNVKITYQKKQPPSELYHGTCFKNINGIKKDGIVKMNRHHVHLSSNYKSAKDVGKRHGKPVVLVLNVEKMVEDGYNFYISENGVWFVEEVPPIYFKQYIYF